MMTQKCLNISGLSLAVKDLILWDSSDKNNTITLRWLKLPEYNSGYLPIIKYQVKISGENGEIHLFNVSLQGDLLPRRDPRFSVKHYKGIYIVHVFFMMFYFSLSRFLVKR